jgi:hypothetical protein
MLIAWAKPLVNASTCTTLGRVEVDVEECHSTCVAGRCLYSCAWKLITFAFVQIESRRKLGVTLPRIRGRFACQHVFPPPLELIGGSLAGSMPLLAL